MLRFSEEERQTPVFRRRHLTTRKTGATIALNRTVQSIDEEAVFYPQQRACAAAESVCGGIGCKGYRLRVCTERESQRCAGLHRYLQQ